jgi:hypothetical protein
MTSKKLILIAGCAGLAATACTPRVQVMAPDKPIEINLNVNITQEVYIKLDKEAEDLIANNADLF